MARIVVEQEFDAPMSEADYARFAERVDPCLDARSAVWRRSYLAVDRRRLTCEFDAPDAEAVREAFRHAGVAFVRAWASEVYAIEDYPELLEKLQRVRAPVTR
jgi:Protein of unknown function (DUF4242)